MKQSKRHLEKFNENPKNPMYLMTEEFESQMAKLDSLNLSPQEEVIIADFKKTLRIYKNRGSHPKRIQLMKHQLIKDLDIWRKSKNLFKSFCFNSVVDFKYVALRFKLLFHICDRSYKPRQIHFASHDSS